MTVEISLDEVLDTLADEYVIAKTPTARKHIANVVISLVGDMPQRGRRAVPGEYDRALRERAEIRKQALIAKLTKGDES